MSLTFDENGICILSSITSVDECEAYKAFLRTEKARHEHERDAAMDYARRLAEVDTVYTRAAADFYLSAHRRHAQDARAIPKRIKAIEAHKARLEVK